MFGDEILPTMMPIVQVANLSGVRCESLIEKAVFSLFLVFLVLYVCNWCKAKTYLVVVYRHSYQIVVMQLGKKGKLLFWFLVQWLKVALMVFILICLR